jgi:hypothetical protein
VTRRPGAVGWRDAPLAIPFALAAVLAATGHTYRAAALAGVGLVAVAARVVLGDRFHRGVARVGSWVEKGLAAVGSTLVWVLVVLPAWIAAVAGRSQHRGGWVQAAGQPRPRRPFGDVAPDRPLGLRVLRGVGAIAVVVALDLAVGSAATGLLGTGRAPAPAPIAVGGGTGGVDARATAPAMAGAEWSRQHFAEVGELGFGFWPFTFTRPLPYDGETITIDGWERASHQEVDADAEATTIAFYGGSTTFGVGQRDEHTIASEVARLAAADGLPVRVRNLGQNAWTSWQEALLFEQLTAAEEDRPDIAVFYDGINDVETQSQPETQGAPTHYDVADVRQRLADGRDLDETEADSVPQDLHRWYSDHSVLARVARGVGGLLAAAPAGAQETGPSSDPEVVGTRAATVYRRARNLVLGLAADRGIAPVFFWQPVADRELDPRYQAATAAVGAPTVDISDTLDAHEDTYVDGAHTNEEGAHLVAVRMWAELRPVVVAARAGDLPPVPAPTDDVGPAGDGGGASVQSDALAPLLPAAADLPGAWDEAAPDPISPVFFCYPAPDRLVRPDRVATSPLLVQEGAAEGNQLVAAVLAFADDGDAEAFDRSLGDGEVADCIAELAARQPGLEGAAFGPSRPGPGGTTVRALVVDGEEVGAGAVTARRGATLHVWVALGLEPPASLDDLAAVLGEQAAPAP